MAESVLMKAAAAGCWTREFRRIPLLHLLIPCRLE